MRSLNVWSIEEGEISYTFGLDFYYPTKMRIQQDIKVKNWGYSISNVKWLEGTNTSQKLVLERSMYHNGNDAMRNARNVKRIVLNEVTV